MPAYIVAYDLKKQGQNYECLNEKLTEFGTYWHMQGSVWIIVTEWTAAQIRDDLKPCLDRNDNLFVGKLSGQAAWEGFTSDDNKWLKSALS